MPHPGIFPASGEDSGPRETDSRGRRPTGVIPYVEAFAFPFRKDHLGIVVFGLFVLTVVPAALAFIPIGGGAVSGALDLVFLAYYAVFLQSILHATMQGSDRIPPWPDFTSPLELFGNLLTIAAPFAASFLPVILVHASMAGISALSSSGYILQAAVPAVLAEGSAWHHAVVLPLVLLGWLYLPMAILAWSFFGGTSILNPVAVFKAAWSTGPSYLVVAFLVWLMVTAAWAVSLIPSRFITSFGSSLLVFYALIVGIRLVGLHYRLHRARLGWERGSPESG